MICFNKSFYYYDIMLITNKSKLQAFFWIFAFVPVVSAGIACLNNPCFHGICIDDLNSTYMCYCIDGYTGVECQTNWDECWSDPCQNGGTCVDGIASYNCTCPDGFIGENCETNFNECESNPCLNNGTCIDMTNEYICHCLPGFSGVHCEVDVAVCNATDEVRCHNGGHCIEGPGFKFYCRCLPGWAGKFCEDQIDECESNPCENGGLCIDIHADYMCACTYGFTGKSCEIQIEFCDENSCSNDALCVVEDGIRVCYCVPDFHGERCELQYDECLLGPRCMNGGTCIDGVDNFTCTCPPNLTGTLCECLMLNETHYDCEYVSPTPLYRTTSTLILNTLTESPSTELISIISTTTYNNVSSENSTVPSETESWTSVITDFISTTEIAQHTSQITGEVNTTQETVTPSLLTTVENVEITAIGTTEFITFEPQTQKTIKSDDSKTKTTCKETSDTVTESTKFTSISEMETTMWINQTTATDFASYPTKVTVQTPNQTDVEMKTSTTTTTKTTVEEVTLTAKMDTTDKMFTDIPTDYYTTEVTTSYTTDAVETTTSFDKTSQTYTTIQSECTDSVCNNHGSCANTLHGVRCHCTFNYGGRFCEEKIYITTAALGGDSFIVHRISNITSISIGFSAKTLITDGHIMHVDIAKGAYMKLFLNSGLLKFKFSCGYQTMLLSELKTYVNKGYPMKIETRLDLYLKQQHCNATLHLNDTVAMSGGQIANISAIDNDVMLYFGNLPDSNNTENKPFVGCIKDLTVNNEKREIFGDAFNAGEITECSSLSCLSRPCLNGGSCREHGDGYICSCANGWMGDNCNQSMCDHNPCQAGGSCVKYPGSGFLCLCPYGKHGIFCEYNVEITRPSLVPITSDMSSFLIYPLSAAAMNSDRFELRLRFHTPDMEQIALLAFVGQNGRHDARSQHLALTFVKGYIMLTWNMGSGPRRVFTSRALSGRRSGHLVRVWRRGRNAGLSVDGRYNVSGNAPTQHQHDRMTLLPYLYIGGHSSDNFADLPHDLPLHSGWRGCVWDVSGQAVGGKVVGGRGVGQCGVAQCTARSCNAPRGVCIHSPATYGCICNEGWFGATCSSQRNACDRSQSHCRGHCVLVGDAQAQCDCPYGKTGENCEQDVFPIDVLFTGVRSYLQLLPREISSVSLSLEAEIKPAKERGLVIFAQTPHFYTALSLQGGLLEYRWTDRLSGLTSLVRSGVVVSMSQWHQVRAGRYGARLYVWIDGTLSTEAMLAHAYPHTASDANIILGGAQDLASVPFDSMSGPPESYSGCIRNLHVNNIPLPFEQRYVLGGRNVGACGTTCAGGRCRRGACHPDRCAPPHGRCRRDRCVCAATRAGDHCQLQINVTIPRFDGDSLLSVPHRGSGRRAGGRLTSLPAHLALNFITSEPDGLLLWINLGIDYLGIGLENGYLRLVWSLHCDGTEVIRHNEKSFPIRPRNVSTILPNVGFLADGNWHKCSLEFGKNITLTMDKRLAYIEETCGREELNDDVDIYVGGVNEDSPAVRKLFPQNFRGCIDKISTGADSYITDYSELYSENINSCQLFPAT